MRACALGWEHFLIVWALANTPLKRTGLRGSGLCAGNVMGCARPAVKYSALLESRVNPTNSNASSSSRVIEPP